VATIVAITEDKCNHKHDLRSYGITSEHRKQKTDREGL
jgi:hypothetical protein